MISQTVNKMDIVITKDISKKELEEINKIIDELLGDNNDNTNRNSKHNTTSNTDKETMDDEERRELDGEASRSEERDSD